MKVYLRKCHCSPYKISLQESYRVDFIEVAYRWTLWPVFLNKQIINKLVSLQKLRHAVHDCKCPGIYLGNFLRLCWGWGILWTCECRSTTGFCTLDAANEGWHHNAQLTFQNVIYLSFKLPTTKWVCNTHMKITTWLHPSSVKTFARINENGKEYISQILIGLNCSENSVSLSGKWILEKKCIKIKSCLSSWFNLMWFLSL